jgi:hypothetical protein
MQQRSSLRAAIGTAAVAIALSVDSLRRSRDDVDATQTTRAVIQGQLDAFNRGDYRAAYRFAAPEIQAQFPLPEFRRMVREGYAPIARSRSASFGPPEVHGDTALVPVTITGQDGASTRYVYSLRRERTGWRITGVGDTRGAPGSPPARRRGGDEALAPQSGRHAG